MVAINLGRAFYDATHCAPASNALLIKSVCVIRMRTSGETPMEATAAVALCIASSLMWPCSQSIMTPCSSKQSLVSIEHLSLYFGGRIIHQRQSERLLELYGTKEDP